MPICYSGIKFFFINVLKRDWGVLNLIRAKREKRLPDVLSLNEIKAIPGTVKTPQNKAYLTLVYSCSLRLHEALCLQVGDVDSNRMRIHIHRGKGAKDRYVPFPESTLKTINAIIDCRTSYYGAAIYKCNACDQFHIVYRSCGNRHCPNCQHHKTRLWIEKQMDRQLPGHHFMVTFTMPQELRSFIRSNQRACYSAMFKASSKTLKKLSRDEKYMGGDLPGFFGVLHTWGRQLQYHPHIHYIIPGGALSTQDGKWHPSRIDYYLPVKAISKMFKAKFIGEMKKTVFIQKRHPMPGIKIGMSTSKLSAMGSKALNILRRMSLLIGPSVLFYEFINDHGAAYQH